MPGRRAGPATLLFSGIIPSYVRYVAVALYTIW